MKKILLGTVLLLGLSYSPSLFAHGKLLNINIVGGGAYPLGQEMTKVTDPADITCDLGPCNPAYFGAGGGAGFDIKFPYGLGVGGLFMFHAFLRKEKPAGNEQELTPFNDILITFPDLVLRILDAVPSYNKKWGTLVVNAGLAFGWLYTMFRLGTKVGLAYLYPVYDIPAFTVQIGLGADFVYEHPIQHPTGYTFKDDMYMTFGLRMSFGAVAEPWGKKKKTEETEELGAGVSDEMKKQDSDGDGLNDYCELMMGTNSKLKDSDDDGLFDPEEDKNKNCMRDEGETDPAVADTDGGGAPDGWEVKAGYDPINPDDDDKDQDFIVDSQDNCLNTPRGVAVNERGCPTIIEKTLLEGVKFNAGTAELTPEGEAALENWVAVLMDNPEMKFEIVAYTDSKGNKKKLIALSKDRAKVVYDFFASKGISESRMTYKGKGPDDPIDSNKTSEGREANNRVEIVPAAE
jgi:outer membrane protein OmpA-like peptidoglycan-associated protein